MTDQAFLDAETRAAVDALVYRLKNRGDADDEPLAAEFIAALKGRGWRPTNARPLPDWHYRTGGDRSPQADKPGGAAYAKAKAEITAKALRPTGEQPVLGEGGDDP